MTMQEQSDFPNMLKRTFWDSVERGLFEECLYQWADLINDMAADGAVVTQIPLDPTLAQRKQQMSMQALIGGPNA